METTEEPGSAMETDNAVETTAAPTKATPPEVTGVDTKAMYRMFHDCYEDKIKVDEVITFVRNNSTNIEQQVYNPLLCNLQ